MEGISTSTLKKHPTGDLSKAQLLKLLSYLEGELQAREITIATLKSEQTRQLVYQAQYGRFGLSDPYLALQRDAGPLKAEPDEAGTKEVYESQLGQLEKLISTQRTAKSRVIQHLQMCQKKYQKVLGELEEEKMKHERDTAQGDDVTYALEKDRERLKQEVETERAARKKLEKDLKRVERELAAQKKLSEQHKAVALALIKDRRKLDQCLEAVLSADESELASAVEGSRAVTSSAAVTSSPVVVASSPAVVTSSSAVATSSPAVVASSPAIVASSHQVTSSQRVTSSSSSSSSWSGVGARSSVVEVKPAPSSSVTVSVTPPGVVREVSPPVGTIGVSSSSSVQTAAVSIPIKPAPRQSVSPATPINIPVSAALKDEPHTIQIRSTCTTPPTARRRISGGETPVPAPRSTPPTSPRSVSLDTPPPSKGLGINSPISPAADVGGSTGVKILPVSHPVRRGVSPSPGAEHTSTVTIRPALPRTPSVRARDASPKPQQQPGAKAVGSGNLLVNMAAASPKITVTLGKPSPPQTSAGSRPVVISKPVSLSSPAVSVARERFSKLEAASGFKSPGALGFVRRSMPEDRGDQGGLR